MKQTELFAEKKAEAASDLERVVLYAFADFQLRGKALAERDTPHEPLEGAPRVPKRNPEPARDPDAAGPSPSPAFHRPARAPAERELPLDRLRGALRRA